ncbi:hypothetical protein MAHJHV64_40460 [Mycobacterium avium subsp. hominissuis]
MLERAVRGVAPDPRVSPADKRLAKAVAKRAGKPIRRSAKRPAGRPKPAEAVVAPPEHSQEPAETQPERPVERLKPAERRAPLRPAFAEPMELPKRGLTTAEDALADVARANRRAGALSQRRNKRRSPRR